MFTVNKNSWHFRWLVAYTACLSDTSQEFVRNKDGALPMDFCSYWRNVILWPAIRITINLIPWAILIATFSYFGLSTAIGGGLMFLFLAMLFLAMALVSGGFWIIKKSARAIVKRPANDEFIAKIYHTYKENYCPMVEYKDDDNG